MIEKYVVVKYLRLSLEDGDKPESDSIGNQRLLLDFHIKKLFKDKEIEVMELIDDGYTGTNMNRPGMKKLLALAKEKQINCILVKDFSRFARDYVDVGLYAERTFPELMIRFISVNDGYDSNDFRGITGGIDIAMKNIAYTMYSRDLSEKIKSARRIQYKNGKFWHPYAAYGYLKSPDDKYKLIVDPETADTVRKIFALRADGVMPTQIAYILNKEHIPTPAVRKQALDPLSRQWNHRSGYYYWTGGIVSRILRDERYTGKLISSRREKVAVGSSKTRKVTDEELIIIENNHEAIVSQSIFDSVQTLITKRKTPKPSQISLKGLVFCGGCKHRMEASNSRGKRRKFACSYKKYTDENECFEGLIAEDDLAEFLIETINKELQRTIDISKTQERADKLLKKSERVINMIEKEINDEKKRKIAEYIKYTKDEINEEEFVRNRVKIDEKINELLEKIKNIKYQSLSKEDAKILNLFGRYTGKDKINSDMVHDLIKAIYIYPDRRIEIVWNFGDTFSH
ncbi:MAG: recombinase family protein [Clostridia bacterium]|nr:recombinase family protein [Clostridia bacterium]